MDAEIAWALERTAPLHGLLWHALEAGTEGARHFFESRRHRVEPFLAAAIVRFEAKQVLQQGGLDVADFEMPEAANNGLIVRVGGDEIRIRKSYFGGIPAPGRSYRLRAYWQFSFFDQLEPVEQPLRLLVTWDVDSTYRLTSVQLVQTQTGGIAPDSGMERWSVALPYPAQFQRTDDVQATVQLDDLETFRLPVPRKTGTEIDGHGLR